MAVSMMGKWCYESMSQDRETPNCHGMRATLPIETTYGPNKLGFAPPYVYAPLGLRGPFVCCSRPRFIGQLSGVRVVYWHSV